MVKYVLSYFWISLTLCFSLQAQNVQLLPFSEGHASFKSSSIEFAAPGQRLSLNFAAPMPSEQGRKSVGKALLYSLILPGAGEYYMGEKGYAGFFFGMEVLGWSALVLNDYHVNTLKDNYRGFAARHASVNAAGKDKQYWINIGKFDDIYAYNDERRRDRNIDAIYPESDTYFWQWDERENRLTYDAKRLKAVSIENREVYIITGILVNHLVSAINAMRLARRHNRQLQARTQYRFYVDNYYSEPLYGIQLSHRF